jgi:Ca-activated chloride channel family protein
MTTVTPPRGPVAPSGDPEALFAEARRHRRQRRLRLLAYVLVLAALAAGAYVVLGHGAAGVGAADHGAAAGQSGVRTVVLLVDVSGSMRADDVKPTRLAAAKAAMRTFVARLPDSVEVGVVAFSTDATTVLTPTRDRARIRTALAALTPEAGTALGDGVVAATTLVAKTLADEGIRRGSGGYLPAAIVLESDGAQNRGHATPAKAAAGAKAAGIRVYGISLGTPDGTVPFGGYGAIRNTISVPPDPATVRSIAGATGGVSFVAPTAARLAAVYRQLAQRLG